MVMSKEGEEFFAAKERVGLRDVPLRVARVRMHIHDPNKLKLFV
jgi:hypothetical protein